VRKCDIFWELAARIAQAFAIYIAIMMVAFAIDDATLSIEQIQSAGWSARQIQIDLDTSRVPFSADISVGQLGFASLDLKATRTHIHCRVVEITNEAYACRHASIAMVLPELGSQQLSAALVYRRTTGELQVQLAGARIGSGSADVNFRSDATRQFLHAAFDHAAAPVLARFASRFGFAVPLDVAAGTVTGIVDLETHDAAIRTSAFDISIQGITANNAEGTIAGDKLDVRLQATVKPSPDGWLFRGAVSSSSGQAYVDPIFLDTGVHALTFDAQGEWSASRGIVMQRFVYEHDRVAHVSGAARIDLNADQPLRELSVADARVEFPGIYATYLEPLVSNETLKALHTNGAIRWSAQVAEGLPRKLVAKLDSINVDGGEHLRVADLSGDVQWHSDEPQRDAPIIGSNLRWRSASVFGLNVGSAELQFQIAGHSFRLLQPAQVPLLDGGLDIDTLRVRNLGEPGVAFFIDATLRPISVPLLCRAFGWPEFGGHIGGVISKLRMRDGVVTLGTTLQGQIFDGDVAVRDLRLEQPFGNWPRFYASIQFDNLNLEQVTSAFSFGRITGRLSGAIDRLELFNWAPVAFDARLYTPPDDPTRHRISQRAVESIGSLGGGGSSITAALSSGF
jgi:hypothetical protein